jgi:serine/threonine-protein kinase
MKSIERFEEAVRDVAQREALLNEARQELERAAWVGGPGRFTEQNLGSFKLGLIIGRGAMGEVYEGFHNDTGEGAAIKLLHRNVLSDAGQVVRFAREAEAVSRLDSPHVVKVLEVGDATSPIPYIAMERMVGDDLASELRSRRKLPFDEVVDLIQQVARGIDAAADAGIVHRDLKPQNLFYHRSPDGAGCWKILDFGVSKLADGTGTLTRGRVVGTPTYMAPEQARGKDVDSRADVYALGAIAYRSLTGHPCFTGREVPQILYDVVHKMPTQPTRLAPELPAAVDAVLAVALAKRPGDRYARATDLARALAAIDPEQPLDRGQLARMAKIGWRPHGD